MKNRSKKNWSTNDHWETPNYLLNWIKKEIFKWKEFFDPCPLAEKNWEEYKIKFDWLKIDWKYFNFINPPYSRKLKEEFIKKSFKEYKKWNICVLLLPSTTEVKWFHKYIFPYAQIYFIKWRVKFKWFNSKWEYVKNRTWQSWSMICVLNKNLKPLIKTLEIKHNIYEFWTN